ncbi:MAG: twin-arginine translocase TatA/TatE family subunit [Dehalococcoidia bacterium]
MGPELFGVGAAEAVLVFVIALVLVGPQRFPDLARQAGRWYRVGRRYTAEITKDVRAAIEEIEDEVKAETGDLQMVREIGEEMETQLKETSSELDAIGEETQQAADGTSTTAATPATSSTPSGAPASASSTVPQTASPPAATSPLRTQSGDTTAAGKPETAAEETTPSRPGTTES